MAVLALLLQAGVAAGTPAPVHAQANPQETARQAAAFDALHERLRGTELQREPSQSQVVARLDELHRLLPPRDALRDLRYRALRCDWDFVGEPAAQFAYAEDALGKSRTLGDRAMEANFLYCRGVATEQLQGMPQALPDYEQGIDIARAIGDRRLLADGLMLRGTLHSLLGEQSLAIPDLLKAQELYESAGLHDDAESLLQDIAVSYRRMGEFDKAREYLEQNEDYVRQLGDWSQLISNLLQQGFLAEEQGRLDDALAFYREALSLGRRHDSDFDVASAHLAMAWPWMLRGDYKRGLDLVKLAQQEFAALGDDSFNDMVYLRLGQGHAGLGQHAQALDWYARAADALERSDNRRYKAMLYRARARSEQATGRYQEAFADLERYIAVHEAITSSERGDQARLLRSQFDSDREQMENRRLASERALQERQLQALLEARRWQWVAMALAGVLLVGLGVLVVRQLARVNRLRTLAATDPLTGVANRRSIEQLGEQALARAREFGEPMAALVLDIDHFKQVNDRHGHPTGDKVLARIAATLRGCLRQFDLLGRTGGEEFLVLLPATGAERAARIGGRLRDAIAAMDCSDLAEGLRCTVSIGMATLRDDGDSLHDLVERADAALYRAKHNGRNRVESDAGPE